jgi:hypothetical protein
MKEFMEVLENDLLDDLLAIVIGLSNTDELLELFMTEDTETEEEKVSRMFKRFLNSDEE